MEASRPVRLNIYDLIAFDRYSPYLSWLGLGAYHTGVEVCGEEFSFGAHPFNFSGIFSISPKSAPMCRYRETIFIGHTTKTYTEIKEILNQLGDVYTGASYNVFTRNCNHFTDELCKILTGNGIPRYINRLASVGYWLQCLVPKSYLTTPSVEDTEELQEASFRPFSGEGRRLADDSTTHQYNNSASLSNIETEDINTRREKLAKAAMSRLSNLSSKTL